MLSEPVTSTWPTLLAQKSRGNFPRSPAITEYARIDPLEFWSFFLVSDLAVAMLSGFGIFESYARPLGYDEKQLWVGLGGFAIAWMFGSYTQRLYGRKALLTDLRHLLMQTLATCALTFGVILLFGFGLNVIGGVSRVWLLGWFAAVLAWTCLARVVWRCYLHHRLRRGDCLERALVVAGSVHAASRLAAHVERESRGHVRAAAAMALPGASDGLALDWLEDMVRRGVVDRVIVGHFSGALAQTNALLARLARLTIDVTLLPDLDGLMAPVLHVDRIGMLPAIELDSRPLTPVQMYLKRAEDLLLAGGLTLFLLPMLLAVSVAVKLDSPGPVLFRQARAGFNGRTFKVWKFRTMHAHARDDRAVRQTSRDDSRVTRVGRFLRRTSLDELPQLFNVLVGDMSVVGPRPHALGMTAVGLPLHEVIEDYSARHRLKPGITGWAQVNGCRGEVDSHEKLRRRVSLDCHYIENWSLGFDLWIILRTATALLGDPNAY
jgi:Undecaprenyl-phosphate glucose phosphotransferase